MKTQEELNALKEEVETLNRKLHELTDEELEQVTGGGYLCRVVDGKTGVRSDGDKTTTRFAYGA